MTPKEINILIDRYLAGETTPEEERQLALAVSSEDAHAEWKAIAEMLGELTVAEAMYDDIMQKRAASVSKPITHTKTRAMWMGWASGVAVAVIAVTFTLYFSGQFNHSIDVVAMADSVKADTVNVKADIQKNTKTKDVDDPLKVIKEIRRVTTPQRNYMAEASYTDSLHVVDEEDYDDYARIDETPMILNLDLDELRDRAENMAEALATVNDDLFDNY